MNKSEFLKVVELATQNMSFHDDFDKWLEECSNYKYYQFEAWCKKIYPQVLKECELIIDTNNGRSSDDFTFHVKNGSESLPFEYGKPDEKGFFDACYELYHSMWKIGEINSITVVSFLDGYSDEFTISSN